MSSNPTLPHQIIQPPTLRTQDITPWDSPVDGNLLLHDLARLIARHVVLPKWGAETLALWTLHTYTFHLRHVSTYIGLESPEKRCGKTTLLGVLSQLVNRPVVAANISSSAFFRVIEELQPTLLIDEADTFLRGNEEIRGILNSGYTRQTAYVLCHFMLTGANRVFSRTLVEHLKDQFDRPWSETRAGKGITELWLAQQLRPYGISPKTLWIGPDAAKGYLKDDFDALFKRYITKADVEELKLRTSPPPPDDCSNPPPPPVS